MSQKLSPLLAAITGQPWAMDPGVFTSMSDLIERHVAGVRIGADEIRAVAPKASALDDLFAATTEQAMTIRGSTAIIPVRGVLARYADQVNGACQPAGRSAESLQADLRAAAADQGITQVLLAIDSPGGAVAGTAETADLIRSLSASGKKVTAFIDGMAASAAYWLASQADEIVASAPTALAGSIGVVTGYVDGSRAQEDRGYKVHVIRSTPLKAVGAMNAGIDSAQLASVQRLIGDLHGAFASAVQMGRGLDDAETAAATTGEIFTAARAQTLGLVDRIMSLDALLIELTGSPAGESTAPAPNPANPFTIQENLPVKHLAFAMALIAAHADQAAAISAEANKPEATEATIVQALLTGQKTAHASALTGLESKLQAEQAAHTATKAELAKAQETSASAADKTAKLEALGKAGPDAGSAATNQAFDGMSGEALWKAQFDADPKLQEAFFAKNIGMDQARAAYVIEQTDKKADKKAA